jgi:hypothetical protein
MTAGPVGGMVVVVVVVVVVGRTVVVVVVVVDGDVVVVGLTVVDVDVEVGDGTVVEVVVAGISGVHAPSAPIATTDMPIPSKRRIVPPTGRRTGQTLELNRVRAPSGAVRAEVILKNGAPACAAVRSGGGRDHLVLP